MAQFAGYHGKALNEQYTPWQELVYEEFHTLAQVPGVSSANWLGSPSKDVKGSLLLALTGKRLVEVLHTDGPE